MKKILIFLVLFFAFSLNVSAETFEFEVGQSEDLYSQIQNEFITYEFKSYIPDEVNDLLNSLEIDASNPFSLLNIFSEDGFKNLKIYFLNMINLPLKSIAVLFTTIMICAICSSFSSKNLQTKSAIDLLCVASVVLVFVYQVFSLVTSSIQVLNVLNLLVISFIPIYAGILIAALKSGVSTAFSSTMFFLCESITYVLNKFVVPFSKYFLGLSVVSGFSVEYKISGLLRLLKKICYIILSFLMVLFLSVFSVQTTLTSVADNAVSKTAKFFVASFVPIIGPSLSEALGGFRNCISLLKSTFGIYIVIVILLIVLPKIFEISAFKLVFTLSMELSDLFNVFSLKTILDAFNQTLSLILAVIFCVSLMFIFSITIISVASKSI